MSFKEQVYRHCTEVLIEKIRQLRYTLSDLKESASNETKSTAGDKHETALAMLQIEQENTNKQLETLLFQELQLKKLNPELKANIVSNGALVNTSIGYIYISIPLGKIIVEGVPVIALSPQSPLGSKLIGLKAGDTVTVNGNNYTIISID